jgi:hypothetical protein
MLVAEISLVNWTDSLDVKIRNHVDVRIGSLANHCHFKKALICTNTALVINLVRYLRKVTEV